MAARTKLVCVLMGESKRNKREDSCNFICSNCRSTADQNVQNFWRIKSYRTLPKLSSKLLPPDEKRYLNILEETTVIKDNRVDTGLLWKSNVRHLPANRKMAINRLESPERKFQEIQALQNSITIKLKSI